MRLRLPLTLGSLFLEYKLTIIDLPVKQILDLLDLCKRLCHFLFCTTLECAIFRLNLYFVRAY